MIPVPKSLRMTLGDTLVNDALTLVGNFPHDLLYSNSIFAADAYPSFRVSGKIIGGSAWFPLFYVDTWEKL